jgi:hypothetical protein
MARGYEYSAELKGTFFRVISFIESEKNGTQIPVYNTTQRIQAILGISERSIFNLKREMKHLAAQVEIDQKKKEEENRKEMEIQQTQKWSNFLTRFVVGVNQWMLQLFPTHLPHWIKYRHIENQSGNGKHLYPGQNHHSNEDIQADQLLFLVNKLRILSGSLSMPCLQKRCIQLPALSWLDYLMRMKTFLFGRSQLYGVTCGDLGSHTNQLQKFQSFLTMCRLLLNVHPTFDV